MIGFEAAGLRLLAELGVASVLGDNEDGLSVEEIAAQTDVDSVKLSQ